MSKNYSLMYRLDVDHGSFSEDDLKKSGCGGADGIILFHLISKRESDLPRAHIFSKSHNDIPYSPKELCACLKAVLKGLEEQINESEVANDKTR